jgi:DNA-binding MarR family transcriptional regulator
MDAPGQPPKALGKVLDFMRLIWALDHGLQSLSKRMQATLGLTGPQRVALRVLGRRPGISAGALADVLRLHPSTLTGILRRLEERGLVRRTHDPEDRRRVLLTLTPRGRKLDVPSPGTIEAVVARILAAIPEARLRPAADLLAAVAAALLEQSAPTRGDAPTGEVALLHRHH